ncbi:cytokine receptor family member B12 [Sinocyclocheilus rhinocerous]|uniref:cytokine receptor family member B12 n=1 Tax=Sinocyclocheilus rhinocerous TaxID=307959 RepID=UPI0007BAA8DD|nr:PREDICTED: interferon lambda receptor 1-like [Sinocyclocheilus rhinocerous]
MTRFLACMFALLQICLTPSKAILSPPKNLTVELMDFKATAEWLPGQGNPPDTRYTLEFINAQKMAGGKWNHTPHCTNTAIRKCELTFDGQPNELHWNYFVRVKTTFKGTSSNWTTTSKSFQPYGDTLLSPPNVKISTEQKSIKINFSHWLELKPDIKPLEYLLYLFESSPAGESKFVALISASESPHIFHDVPPGKNYCVSVSASHQQASKNNNFNTTKCAFLLDSTRSFVLVVCIVAMLLIIFSTGIFLPFGCFYHMRLQIKNLRIPKPLIVIPGYKRVLKPTPEESQPITVTPPKKEMNAERRFSSSEEDSKDGSMFYQPRENLTSSIASVNPPEQDEEAEASNQCDEYTLANDIEDSEENEISEMDDDSMHPGSESESGSFCANTLNNSTSSKILQTVTVNAFVNSEMDSNYAEETLSCSSGSGCEREVPAEEEEDSLFLPDSNSESGYEPRHDKVL